MDYFQIGLLSVSSAFSILLWPMSSAKASLPSATTVQASDAIAQAFSSPSLPPLNDINRVPAPQDPLDERLPQAVPLPPLDELITPSSPTESPEVIQPFEAEVLEIQQFRFIGNTALSTEALQDLTAEYLNQGPLSFSDILTVRDAITQAYIDQGYTTSGAIFPPQALEDSTITFEIVEGGVNTVEIVGNERLNSGYVRSRLARAISTPLNQDDLEEQLNLLLLDPLIDSISADVQASNQLGENTLVVTVAEADSLSTRYRVNNNRSPSVGSVRNQLQLREANLLSMGDALSIGYSLTAGSDDWNASYTLPINASDGTLQLSLGNTSSNIVEAPFDRLDINSDSTTYELSYRQPIVQKATQTLTEEFALGFTASHQRSQTAIGFDGIGPFPLSPGANAQGETKVSALRFLQDWTQRSRGRALALRSQFTLGLDILGATTNADGPDSQFFAWKGQGQWVQDLGNETLLVVNSGVQLSTDALLTSEQFGLGGQSTIRGYRQDELLTDNGILTSIEVRIPAAANRRNDLNLQFAPFIDMGYGWNTNGPSPENPFIAGVGAGLILSGERLSARVDWGVPLVSTGLQRDSFQENGLYFSLDYNFLSR